MIPVQLCFYKDSWLNRIFLTWHKYGHCNLKMPSGTIINCSRFPDLVGCLDAYEEPDKVVTIYCDPDHVERAIEYSYTRLTVLSIFRRNCVRCAAIAIYGNELDYYMVRLYADYPYERT